MNQKKQSKLNGQRLTVLMVLSIVLASSVLAVASASTVAVLNVAPTTDSSVITVIGSGFNVNESVYLALANQTTGVVVYNFTESITTNSIGMFTKDVTLPSGVYGTYIIYAKTSTVTANTQYTITLVTNPKIAVSPPNSNIFKVAGSGFKPLDIVTFTLVGDRYTSAYNFTDIAMTDNLGNFTVTLIVPTSLNGNYTLMAATKTGATANEAITVPNLTGPKGDTGDTGDKGAKGVAGAAGKGADNTMLYIAIIISVIAAVISIAALVKDREPDE